MPGDCRREHRVRRSLASEGFPSTYSKSVCVRLRSEISEPTMLMSHATPDEHTPTPPRHALSMASSHHVTHPRQVSARLAPPLCCCAIPLLLPVRAHPYSRLCTTRVSILS